MMMTTAHPTAFITMTSVRPPAPRDRQDRRAAHESGTHLRVRLGELHDDLTSERDDAALALACARGEQARGVPTPLCAVLAARLQASEEALAAVEAALAHLS